VEIIDVAPAGLAMEEARQRLFVAAQQLAQGEVVAVHQARRKRFVGLHRLRILPALEARQDGSTLGGPDDPFVRPLKRAARARPRRSHCSRSDSPPGSFGMTSPSTT